MNLQKKSQNVCDSLPSFHDVRFIERPLANILPNTDLRESQLPKTLYWVVAAGHEAENDSKCKIKHTHTQIERTRTNKYG